MAKNKKSRAKYAAPSPVAAAVDYPPLMLGGFTVPKFDRVSAVFGAQLNEYPTPSNIPDVDRKFVDAFDALFFRGGSLADHGLKLKAGIDRAAAMTAIRAWMGSFDPKHEHKTATVAWALSEWCEAS